MPAPAGDDDPRERTRRRLAAALGAADGGTGSTASPPARRTGAGGGGPASAASAASASASGPRGRPPTEAEQEAFAVELLRENAEMRRAFAASYYIVHAMLGGWAGWLLAAHTEAPWSGDATTLAPLRDAPAAPLDAGEAALALAAAVLVAALAAAATYTGSTGLLRVAAVAAVYPALRVAATAAGAGGAWAAAHWPLAWLPAGPPAVVAIQFAATRMFDAMDRQVVEFYRKHAAPLKGA
jgi:hypothetical protein